MSTQQIEEPNKLKKGGVVSIIKKLTNSGLRLGGTVMMIISYIVLSEVSVTKYLPGGPAWLLGYGIALLLFLVDSAMRVFADPNNGVSSRSTWGKIKWFIMSPYIFIIFFSILLFIIGSQIIGYIAVSSEPNTVKEIITQQMSGLWGGLKLLSIISIVFYTWIMSNYPFPLGRKPGGLGNLNWSPDNVHSTGISCVLLLLMVFFTVYFTVEFETKFVVQ